MPLAHKHNAGLHTGQPRNVSGSSPLKKLLTSRREEIAPTRRKQNSKCLANNKKKAIEQLVTKLPTLTYIFTRLFNEIMFFKMNSATFIFYSSLWFVVLKKWNFAYDGSTVAGILENENCFFG